MRSHRVEIRTLQHIRMEHAILKSINSFVFDYTEVKEIKFCIWYTYKSCIWYMYKSCIWYMYKSCIWMKIKTHATPFKSYVVAAAYDSWGRLGFQPTTSKRLHWFISECPSFVWNKISHLICRWLRALFGRLNWSICGLGRAISRFCGTHMSSIFDSTFPRLGAISETKSLKSRSDGRSGRFQVIVAYLSCSLGDRFLTINSTLLYELSSASNAHSCIVTTTDLSDEYNFARLWYSLLLNVSKFSITEVQLLMMTWRLPYSCRSSAKTLWYNPGWIMSWPSCTRMGLG